MDSTEAGGVGVDGKDDESTGNSSKKRKGTVEETSGDKNNDDKLDNQLQNQLKQHKKQNEYLVKRRSNVFKSMVALLELYETGLDAIARMNDLSFVPDNVMPDKIPDS